MVSQVLPLAQLARQLPAALGDRPPNRSTLYRWATTGLKSRAGQRIRLECEFIGGTLCSRVGALLRLGQQKDDRAWQEVPVVSQRERADMEQRAREAMARMESWRPRQATRPR